MNSQNNFIRLAIENEPNENDRYVKTNNCKKFVLLFGLLILIIVFKQQISLGTQNQPISQHSYLLEERKQNQAILSGKYQSQKQEQQTKQEESKFIKMKIQFKTESKPSQQFKQILMLIITSRSHDLAMRNPKIYSKADELPILELPICVYSHNLSTMNELQQIQKPLIEQYSSKRYQNFIHIFSTAPLIEVQYSQLKSKQFFSTKHVKLQQNSQGLPEQQVINLAFKTAIINNCPIQSIVFLCRHAVKKNILTTLNLLYQIQNIWLTYSREKYPSGEIHTQLNSISSFYVRVLKQIPNQAIINHSKKKRSDKQQQLKLLGASMLKLTRFHGQALPIFYIYEGQPISSGLDYFRQKITQTSQLYVENPMMYLYPNRDSQKQINRYLTKLTSKKASQAKYRERNGIKLEQMLEALQYLELKNLHNNHVLNTREIMKYEQKYQISKYINVELPLCVIIPSRNNVPDDRFIKVLNTLKMQNYSNYHIVFIDDASTDQTYAKTQKYLKQLELYNRTQMIKNSQQKFATYNIQNAIHNYCNSKQIVVLLDGDDELIGKQVFQLINTHYQKRENWIVYFSFISNIYMYGVSKILENKMFIEDGPRERMHVIGALRTFYVDLYRKIQQKDHKNNKGVYLDSLYDDAMQYPLMEMSGKQHIQYVPEIVYFYNQNYGNNDGSNPQSLNDRQQHFKQILSRPKYKRIQRLFED